MDKNLLLKIVVILVLIVFAGLVVYPPADKLKPGLDLAGGTSMVYEIDTTGLEPKERSSLAERMIPILRRRVDPTNVANIVMRPQGDTRIEIQLPVASVETKEKRQQFETALQQLERTNLNLLKIKRALSEPAAERQKLFEQFAQGSEKRIEILDQLASAYDARLAAQQKRDKLAAQLESIEKTLDDAGFDVETIKTKVYDWANLDQAEREKKIDEYFEQLKNRKEKADAIEQFGEGKLASTVNDFAVTYKNWADVVNGLVDPEEGENARYKEALARLSEFNISVDQLMDVLEMPEGAAMRDDAIANLLANYPARAEQLQKVVDAYAAYSEVGGRLDDPEDLKRMLKGSGVLEFRILPTYNDGVTNVSEMEMYKEALQQVGPRQSSDTKHVWLEIEDFNNWKLPNSVIGMFGDKYYVLASNQPDESILQRGDQKWQLKKARPSYDQMGAPAVSFTLDTMGSKLFYNVTRKNIGRNLAIVLDDMAISAPRINSAISGSGIIEGDFTQTEVDNLVNKLNAGSFPARLSDVPISEKTIGPAIGVDNRDQGIKAGLIGLGIVAVFMVLYYLLPGFVADIALLMNIVFVLAVMVIFQATFTLPGIAGIILTIGMSVDANVLIFERIREEQLAGATLKTAISNGYQRAFRTIFDANVTTFITAVILYMAASEEIKGFAIVLMIGIVSSMFTALFVTRVVFDLLTDQRIIRDHLVMLRLIKKPNFNWMGIRKVFFVVSTFLVVGGLTIFFTRDEEKNSKYDIEFTGGTSVQITFREGTNYSRSDVEDAIREKGQLLGSPALMAAKVYSIGESGLQYEITTTATNKTTSIVKFAEPKTPEQVTQEIRKARSSLGVSMPNLEVGSEDGSAYAVSTSLVNKGVVAQVLNTAFADAQVSAPVVDEVVNKAVRDTFEGLLSVRENLRPVIVSTENITGADVDLADYIGGIRIRTQLDRPVSGAQLKQRFRDLRFKPDAQDFNWYKYLLTDSEFAPLGDDQQVQEFVYVTVHPEAGYRDLSPEETERFVEMEKDKVIRATSYESTLARVTQIDPSIGEQSQNRALVAIVLSLIAIVGYVWIRFGNARYGFAAIAALVHDVCITLGTVAACTYIAGTPIGRALGIGDFKINLEMIAAFLTIIGYSLNDTIVVFDRIRENRGKLKTVNAGIITESINQTLSRTLLTSFTTFLVVLVMYIWGGSGLRGFTFAMLVGILIGTYSSIAIASPILLLGSRDKSTQKK